MFFVNIFMCATKKRLTMHMHMYVHIYRRNICQESSYILRLHLEFCIVSDEAISYTRLHKNIFHGFALWPLEKWYQKCCLKCALRLFRIDAFKYYFFSYYFILILTLLSRLLHSSVNDATWNSLPRDYNLLIFSQLLKIRSLLLYFSSPECKIL